MKLLDKKDYYKLIEPIREVTINNLFARFVIENKVDGKIYVDNTDNPKTFYVIHPYGMSLLFGDYTNTVFNTAFKEYIVNTNGARLGIEWMQAFPHNWDSVLENLFEANLTKTPGEQDKALLELYTRVNFTFDKDKYLAYKQQNINTDPKVQIVRTDKKLFEEMKGTVVPARFWNNADDFVNNGAGFSLLYDNKLAATAFSAFIFNDTLELGIETCETFRGTGFAGLVCAALVDYALDRNLEPVWGCRLDNVGSFRLARKIGFEVSKEISFYKLNTRIND